MPRSDTHRPYRVVYAIVERREKKFWSRIGAAFQNQDGSVNVLLDALPMNGELQIRDAQPRDAQPRDAQPRERGESRFGDSSVGQGDR